MFLTLSAALAWFIADLNQTYPDFEQLAEYRPPLITSVRTVDGLLIDEYALERRIYTSIDNIPFKVRNAFIAAEDAAFERHKGVDYRALMRAVARNIRSLGTGERVIGASTITQQVVKNVVVGSDRTIKRKVAEAMFAWRIEEQKSKDEILEVYLNDVYFGLGAYGVATAAKRYFHKPLSQLTLAEAAYLAALPKAPNNYHPLDKTERAVERRNWVLDRMVENGIITEVRAAGAKAEPLEVAIHRDPVHGAGHFGGEVMRLMVERYGGTEAFAGGYQVTTSLDPVMQKQANRALLAGLVGYDTARGWRGPIAEIAFDGDDWATPLADVEAADDLPGWRVAVVLSAGDKQARIGLRASDPDVPVETGTVPIKQLAWAREARENGRGPKVRKASDVLKRGDVVYVEPVDSAAGTYRLRQVPKISGGLVALDPHTGRVLAMAGGASFANSPFNRATQAMRQPGSSFKPIVYAAAMELGYTPESVVVDAPFAISMPEGIWQPTNYSNKYYGPQTLRNGLKFSRNVMTVRLAGQIGFETVGDYAHRFGVLDRARTEPALALGAGETTLIRMAGAYATFANGGLKVNPTLIDRIVDRHGEVVYDAAVERGEREIRLISEMTAGQMTSLLLGVVEGGTGTAARAVGRPIAGKTGTTNDHHDAWFMGFTPDLVVGVYVGFDDPKPLGRGQTGGRLAAPIFTAFMQEALAGTPVTEFDVPKPLPRAETRVTASFTVDRWPARNGIFTILEPGQAGFPQQPSQNLGPTVTKTSPRGKTTYSYQEGSKVGTYTINGRTFTYQRD